MPPLYMDIHTVDSEDFSVEEVVKAHMEDLAVQDRFGVRQLKYWVNVPARTLFCLMEGPDKKACHDVHAQSHGQTACNIIEVKDNEFDLFLGTGGKDHTDLALTPAGDVDTGYRSLLAVHLISISGENLEILQRVSDEVRSKGGNIIPVPNEIVGSFETATDAMACVDAVNEMLEGAGNLDYRIALVTGRPVDEVGNSLF